MAKYFTIQNNVDTSITSGTLVGQLGFAASNDSDGGDATVITAAVIASADGTFDATNNPGSLVFATSPTGPATGQIKIVDSGHLEPIGNKIKNLGSSSSQWKDLYVDQIYFDGLGPQTLPFNDFNVSATGDTVTVTDGNTVTFTGQDSVTVSRNGQTIIISGAAGGGGGGMTSWDLGVGTESVIDVTDGESVTFSGLNQITTTRTAQRIDIDVDLSDYYTSSQVDTISGNLQSDIDGKDNYQYWTITDGVTSENISTTDSVKFTGGSNIGVNYNTANNTVTISSTAGGGSMSSWNLQVGSETPIDVTDSENVSFSGLNQIKTTRTSQRVDIDIDLSDYYTSAQVDTISGNLQTQIDANDNYQYWTITDGVNSENVSTTDTIKFTGGGDVGVSYNTSNNTVTISATAGGGGTPGGSDTHVQFNDGGSTFGGNAGFTYDKTAQKMYSRSYYTNITDSGNITSSVTLDLDQSNFHQVTLSGNPITIAVANGDVGQRFIIRLKQDNTGSRTVNWFSTISWPGGGPPTLSTATGVADLLGFVVTAANEYDGFLMVSGIY